MFFACTCLRMCAHVCACVGGGCVCVYHLNRCKTSYYCRGVWHSCSTTHNEAADMSGKGNVAGFLCLQFFFLCIVPPLDLYILSLLVYTVIVSCDYSFMYIFIYMYMYIHRIIEFLVFLHVRCVPHQNST